MDANTGFISGSPQKEIKKQEYQIKLINPWSNIGIIVNITVAPTTYPILKWYNETINITPGKNYAHLQICEILGDDLEFSVDNLIDGFTFNSEDCSISGMILKETTTVTDFTCINKYGSLHFHIKIFSIFSDIPVIANYTNMLYLFYRETYTDLQVAQCVGRDLEYSIGPELPRALTFDEKTGLINGRVEVEPGYGSPHVLKCINENGTDKAYINVYIETSDYPILIDNIEILDLTAGEELTRKRICTVTGKDLTYSIEPELPEKITIDNTTGYLNGYVTTVIELTNYTVKITGSGRTVSFWFVLLSHLPEYPVIVPSTIIDMVILQFNSEIKSKQLFVAVGTNISISVFPGI